MGICPFYKYRATDRSEIVTCKATGEHVALPDVESFTKFITKMPFCLEIEFYNCPEYKKKMEETRSESVDWEERFSKEHPLGAKIKDTDVFLHGTSSRKYLAIQAERRLLRSVPVRNWGISRIGVCFEKYVKQGQYCDVVDLTMKRYCEVACEKDGSSEGVVLQIKGRELRKLACPIYGDWNKNYPLERNSEGIPIDVDSKAELLSIIVDSDIPLRYLKVVKRMLFKG